MNNDLVTKRYIQLRDKLDAMEKEHKENIAPVKEAMAKIEIHLLGTLTASGTESMRTKFGTFFKAKKTSATVADKQIFLDFIKENGAWELLDIRALKSGIETYKEEREGDLPPGINWREETTVNIRKA